MSLARAVEKRRVDDAYFTPDACATHCVGLLEPWSHVISGNSTDERNGRVLEPSCGDGAFVRALFRAAPGAQHFAIDINDHAEAVRPFATFLWADYLACPIVSPMVPSFDIIAGNPPYQHAEEFVRRSLQLVREGGVVGMLLRVAFLESAKRLSFWREHPAAEVVVLAERPSFTQGGTDSAAYAFFIWRAGYTGNTRLRVTSWKGHEQQDRQQHNGKQQHKAVQ